MCGGLRAAGCDLSWTAAFHPGPSAEVRALGSSTHGPEMSPGLQCLSEGPRWGHGGARSPAGLSSAPPRVPPDVKFDAVSGDYYPIVYFNDYWNLQKDYYPINESLASLPLRVSFCPLSLWRWQLYAAQSTKSPWNFLGDELYEQSDEEQDSVKVSAGPPGCRRPGGSGPWAGDSLQRPTWPWGPAARLAGPSPLDLGPPTLSP